MIIKMLLTFDYNPDTNEYTPISKELVKDENKKKSASSKIPESDGSPKVYLSSNKIELNKEAAELIGVQWEDRVSINYAKVDGVLFPIIGKDEAFDTKGSGNKVTKSLTISCRGNANDKLRSYGTEFDVTKLKDKEGLFVLLGNADRPTEPEQDDVKVPESEELNNIDLPLSSDLQDKDAFEITDETFEI